MTHTEYDEMLETVVEECIVEEYLTDVNNNKMVILFNDEVNTFDWVVDSLMMVCDMSEEEAVKKTYEAHDKGSAEVFMSDDEEKCEDVKRKLEKKGLSVELM